MEQPAAGPRCSHRARSTLAQGQPHSSWSRMVERRAAGAAAGAAQHSAAQRSSSCRNVWGGRAHVCEVPLLAELAHRGGAVALGELALVGRQDEGHVAKGGRGEAQRLVDQHLAGAKGRGGRARAAGGGESMLALQHSMPGPSLHTHYYMPPPPPPPQPPTQSVHTHNTLCARAARTWRSVLGRCSSARMTWVMRISASSMATAARAAAAAAAAPGSSATFGLVRSWMTPCLI